MKMKKSMVIQMLIDNLKNDILLISESEEDFWEYLLNVVAHITEIMSHAKLTGFLDHELASIKSSTQRIINDFFEEASDSETNIKLQ